METHKNQLKDTTELIHLAQILKQKAENKTKRHWKNAWTKAKWNRAGIYYEQSALHYCRANQDEEAKQVLLKSYECFKRKREWQNAAKVLEQVIKLDIDKLENMQALSELAMKTAAVYDKANLPDNAAQLLEKVAKVLEDRDANLSEILLDRAVEIVELENRPIQAAFLVAKILHMQLAKQSKAGSAIIKAKKLIRLYQEADHTASFRRSVLITVFLQVYFDQINEAKMTLREHGGNCTSEQQVAMDTLISGHEKNQSNLVNEALENDAFASINLEFREMADEMKNAFKKTQDHHEESNDKKVTIDVETNTDQLAALAIRHVPKPTMIAQRKLTQRSNTLAAIMVPSAAYADEAGYHVNQPESLGMTADQYREKMKESLQINDPADYE